MLVSHRMIRVLFLLLLFPAVAGASPLGRSFTYQGQLSQSGTPLEGTVTLRFSLWDMAGTGDPPTGGALVGSAQTVADVPISGGLFSVELNSGTEFGGTAFNGEARWLQVEVCTDGTCGSSTVLGPRQPMTAAPYALGPWQLSGTSISYTNGKVGIGTAAPGASLHVKTLDEGLRIEGSAIGNPNSAWISFSDASGTSLGYVGDGSSQDANMYLSSYANDVIIYTAGGYNVTKANGRVGIGTTAPAEKLDVRGNIKLGTSGQYFARGRVSSTGAVLSGTGFTASQVNLGIYSIQFDTAFPTGQSPIITASAESLGSALFAVVAFTTTTQAQIRIFNAAGAATSRGFFFITAGTR
ncbi:MAG: hypothetical protein FD129_2960 [bacterium]|nr:MAG: hypothetical protein FD129_2960 [bacterium]